MPLLYEPVPYGKLIHVSACVPKTQNIAFRCIWGIKIRLGGDVFLGPTGQINTGINVFCHAIFPQGGKGKEKFEAQPGLGALHSLGDKIKPGLVFVMEKISGIMLKCMVKGRGMSHQKGGTHRGGPQHFMGIQDQGIRLFQACQQVPVFF